MPIKFRQIFNISYTPPPRHDYDILKIALIAYSNDCIKIKNILNSMVKIISHFK